ncbi:MAG: carbohydrate transporter substrate-binding protein, partial [Thermomicrobiales bacterium]|nr:carbohydrate transporter substrate-binding protein [Thermomicrobiales bacterium]
MRVRAVLLAAALVLVPLSAWAADLVIWWEKGFYPAEDAAVRELVAAFEKKTGKTVELVRHDFDEQTVAVQTAIDAGRPPDFLFGQLAEHQIPRWATEGRLVDLTDAIGSLKDQFDAGALELSTLRNDRDGRTALYALPMGRDTTHIHVWLSLLEQAGFRREDIPTAWDPFWSFWCDKVQPAVRKALGRDDIWGTGLTMSVKSVDTRINYIAFQLAYGTPWASLDGRLQVDDPAVRAGMIKSLDDLTSIWRKGCTPPESVDWSSIGNNKAFVEQRVVMTINGTLSTTNLLKETRPDDYYSNAATIDWPRDRDGRPLAIYGALTRGAVFAAGGHVDTALDFVRSLVEGGWLVHWLTFASDRLLPPMPEVLDSPFWLDTGDPHRMQSVMQTLTQPRFEPYLITNTDWRLTRVFQEDLLARAVHGVVADGL